MTLKNRLILFLTFALLVASGLFAQQAGTDTAASKPTSASETSADSAQENKESAASFRNVNSNYIRGEFSELLRRHPPELSTILSLDPTLLSNDAFLAGYPDIQTYVKAHPEVRRNPRFYLDYFEDRPSTFNDLVEKMLAFTVFLCIVFAMGWFVRTVVEQKRWNRMSRTQTEVHNKILDRFGTSTELIEYMKTPAGTKFLESAPIPLRDAPMPQNATAARILWSIQIGIVIAAGSAGTLMISGRFAKESAESLYAMGMIGLCVGAGFVASAIVSHFVSKQLGLWQPPAELQDSGPVR